MTLGQRRLHLWSELAALAFVAPFGLYLAADAKQRPWVRWAGGILAAGTILIDGTLALRWAQERNNLPP